MVSHYSSPSKTKTFLGTIQYHHPEFKRNIIQLDCDHCQWKRFCTKSLDDYVNVRLTIYFGMKLLSISLDHGPQK